MNFLSATFRFRYLWSPLLGLYVLLSHVHGQAPRPNIVVIMSDDMGYSDPGCYGGEIATPHLDRLASQGLRFTHFTNTGRCCPTRASLLTGLYAHQAGMGQMTDDLGESGYRGELSRNAVTLAEVLREAGYHTLMAGKWHVTTHLKPDGDKKNWPLQRGFDRFYGTIIGAGSFYDPWTLTRGNQAITPENDPEYHPEIYYYTDAISDNAARFIDEHTKAHSDKPFFLYLSYTAPHWPMHALDEDIAKYRGRYDAGYQAIREERLARMKQLGVIGADVTLTPAPRSWDDVPTDRRAWEIRCMEVYAAMIDRMDQGIGNVIKSIERSGKLENTLIFYLQDNGGCAENYGRNPRKNPAQGVVPMKPDELQTAIFPVRTRAGEPVLMGPEVMPGPANTYIAYGESWANVSNTPFRRYKSENHEGGILSPLIVFWPKGITDVNGLRHQPSHLIDIMPTLLDVSGATYPETFADHRIQPLEGISLVPTFAQDQPVDRVLHWEHYGRAALRQGHWKLVRLAQNKPWELYDLDKDRTEMNDLASTHTARVSEMARLWEYHSWRTRIYPQPSKKR